MSTEATEVQRRSTLPPVVVGRPLWESSYALALVAVDALMVTIAFGVALLTRFGAADAPIGSPTSGWLAGGSYAVLVGLATPTWVLVLAASRAYEARYLGLGSDEFKRVANASIRFGALLAFASYATRAELSRGVVFVAVPTGAVLLLGGRYAARKVLHGMRLRGAAQHRVVAVGSASEVTALAAQLLREPHAGMRVVAACLPDYELAPVVVGSESLVLLGPARALAGRLAEVGADTVAVAGTTALSSRELRELAWELEGTGVDLVVAPALTDVAGPRIHVRPVAGLPLLHVEEPTFGGVRKIIKGAIDLLAALTALLLLLLPGVVIALLIKRDSPGPVFYRQERVGKDGRPFRIWKFRTMRTGADLELAALAARNEHDGPLFKIKDDPRVTPVGKVLRRLSIDELPQLLNVLNGSMSLVGPRPPLQREVDLYADHVHRRLLVKPGMTGLWQVSGRADLEWDEAVRLDLYYVENWSVALDFMILWKTVFAVVQSDGAY